MSFNPNWPLKALESVCIINPRCSLKGRGLDSAVSFVPMTDLPEGKMDFKPQRTKRLGDGGSYTYFEENDVLLAKVSPCFENGKGGIAKELVNGAGFGSSELHVLRCSETVLPEWIYYSVQHPSFRGSGTFEMTGSGGLRRLPREFVYEYQIPVPPVREQRSIIIRLQEKFAELDRARKALADQFDAAEKLSAATLRDVFCGDAAKVWPERQLGEVIVLRNEIVHPRDKPTGQTVFVGMEHVESHTGQRIGSVPLDLTKLTGRKARFYPGDLVYGYLRPYLNKLWLADREGCCSVDQYVFTVRAELSETEFVAHFMRSDAYLKTAPVGLSPGQLPRIRTDEMAAVPIRLPNLDTQRTIVRELNRSLTSARELCSSLSDQLAALDRYPAALLRDAFAGRL